MKKTYKLKRWVKVVLTIILIATMVVTYRVAGIHGENTQLAMFSWLIFLSSGMMATTLWGK